MIFHVLSIFPDFFRGPFDYGVVARAREAGAVEIRVHNLRDWTYDRHKTVDDRPFGGGEGMLLKPEPVFRAVESIWPERQPGRTAILLSASGRLFQQSEAERLSRQRELLFICGRYEGVDERVATHLADEEYSIGNFVLSGGELAAAVMMDSIARLLPGVLGNEDSTVWESFSSQGHGPELVDAPQFTRPADFRGIRIPDVLLSGHHEEIRNWRRKAAEEKTARMRPDLLERRSESVHAEPEGN
jgi:tRNA (guanine37-N1)-methyltransferase